jgi:thiamine-monophosphate kinase
MNEFDRIAKYFAPLAAEAGLCLQDDAAVFEAPEGCELVVTKDAIVQGVHFVGDEPPAMIAQKLLRTNLSDLAAMGAKPLYYLLAVMLPKTCDDAWLAGFAAGLKADQDTFAIRLIGGDSTASPHLCLSVTAFGTVLRGQALKRSGARVGDGVFVSGTIGDARLGLQLVQGAALQVADKNAAIARYQLPTPRLALGQALRGVATSAMDVSDGLMQDASHIARASGVGIRMIAEQIPLSDAVKQAGISVEQCVTAGDDYELLFTAPKDAQVEATLIGEVVAGSGVELLKSGVPAVLQTLGYQHF